MYVADSVRFKTIAQRSCQLKHFRLAGIMNGKFKNCCESHDNELYLLRYHFVVSYFEAFHWKFPLLNRLKVVLVNKPENDRDISYRTPEASVRWKCKSIRLIISIILGQIYAIFAICNIKMTFLQIICQYLNLLFASPTKIQLTEALCASVTQKLSDVKKSYRFQLIICLSCTS